MKKLNYSLGDVPDQPCEYCAIAKAKKNNVCKMTPCLDLWKGKGWFIDLSNMKWAALGPKKCWALLVDFKTDYCVSRFIRHKDILELKGLELFKKICAMKFQVKMTRMDNTGENKLLQKA